MNWERSIRTTSKPADCARAVVRSVDPESMISNRRGRRDCIPIASRHSVQRSPALSVGTISPTSGTCPVSINPSPAKELPASTIQCGLYVQAHLSCAGWRRNLVLPTACRPTWDCRFVLRCCKNLDQSRVKELSSAHAQPPAAHQICSIRPVGGFITGRCIRLR